MNDTYFHTRMNQLTHPWKRWPTTNQWSMLQVSVLMYESMTVLNAQIIACEYRNKAKHAVL
jgi:hypothetical protein